MVLLLGVANPISALGKRWLEGNETQRTQKAHVDAQSWDVKHGEALLESLRAHEALRTGAREVVVFGNSQQYTISLPRGGVPDDSREADLASDIWARRLDARVPGAFSFFNAAAPNETFVEALWQALWLFRVAKTPPAVLVLQSSFDTYRKAGIRAGYQTLLEDPAFVAVLDSWQPASNATYLSDFATTRKAFNDQKVELASGESGQTTLEQALRKGLERLPVYRERQKVRLSLFEILYHLRVLALHVSPTAKRHIAGAPRTANFDALADLMALAREANATIFVYNAPINPAVDMFYPEEYSSYVAELTRLCEVNGARFIDLATAVSAAEWGYWIDAPDPIHVDEHGHQTIAARLDSAWSAALEATVKGR